MPTLRETFAAVAIGLGGLAIPGCAGGCVGSGNTPLHPASSRATTDFIGKAGDASFHVISYDGKHLLAFDGYEANGVLAHVPGTDWKPGTPHTFSAERLTKAGDGDVYIVTVDGTRYSFVDGNHGGGISRLPD